MAPITWKNIAAPSFSDALEGTVAAGKSLGSSADTLQGIVKGIQATGERREDTRQTGLQQEAADFANSILDQTGDHAQAQAGFKSKLAELGGSVDRAADAGTAYGTEREQIQGLKNRNLIQSASDAFMKEASASGDTKKARAIATEMAGGNAEVLSALESTLTPVSNRMNKLSAPDEAAMSQRSIDVNATRDLKLQEAQQVGDNLQTSITSLQTESGINPELFKTASGTVGGVQAWAAKLYEDSGMIDKTHSINAIKETRKALVEDYGEAKADTLLFAAINKVALDRHGFLEDKGVNTRELKSAAVSLLGTTEKLTEAESRYNKWQSAFEKDTIRINQAASNDLIQTRNSFQLGGINRKGFTPGAINLGGLESSAFSNSLFDKLSNEADSNVPVIKSKPSKKVSTKAPESKKTAGIRLLERLRSENAIGSIPSGADGPAA